MDFGCVTIILPNAPIRLLNIFMIHPPTQPPPPYPHWKLVVCQFSPVHPLHFLNNDCFPLRFPRNHVILPKSSNPPPHPHLPPLSIEKIIFLKAFWFNGFSSINLRHVFQIMQALKIIASLRLELRAVSGSSFKLTTFFSFYEQNGHFTLTVIH